MITTGKEFFAAISKVKHGVSNKGTLLHCVRAELATSGTLGVLTLEATNFDLYTKAILRAETPGTEEEARAVKLEEQKALFLPFDDVYKLARHLRTEKSVVFFHAPAGLGVSAGRASWILEPWPEADPRDWPRPGPLKDPVTLNDEVSAALAHAIEAVRGAASTEVTRYYLNGVCIDTTAGAVVATDGHRALWHEFHLPEDLAGEALFRTGEPGEDPGRPIVPNAALTPLLEASGPITLSRTRIERGGVSALLVDAAYPDWRRAVPKQTDIYAERWADLATADVLKAIKAVTALDPGKHRFLRLEGDRISSGEGSACYTIQGNKMQRPHGFNAKYLEHFAALGGFKTMHIFENVDPRGPALFTWPSYPALTGCLMPIRL